MLEDDLDLPLQPPPGCRPPPVPSFAEHDARHVGDDEDDDMKALQRRYILVNTNAAVMFLSFGHLKAGQPSRRIPRMSARRQESAVCVQSNSIYQRSSVPARLELG